MDLFLIAVATVSLIMAESNITSNTEVAIFKEQSRLDIMMCILSNDRNK